MNDRRRKNQNEVLEQLRALGEEAIQHAARSRELAGLSGEDFDAFSPVLTVLRELAEAVVELRDHVCKWDENDRCPKCGADGRA